LPNLYIVAGCNGAGKTTASFTILPEMLNCREFVNADSIAAGLSPFNPESVAIEAGRLMLSRIRELMLAGWILRLKRLWLHVVIHHSLGMLSRRVIRSLFYLYGLTRRKQPLNEWQTGWLKEGTISLKRLSGGVIQEGFLT